jgi:predicted anti-sigma-YlaC factor YlaD
VTDPTPTCASVREAVSAALDGEDHSLPAAAVHHHLAACGGCRGFEAALSGVNRRLTVAGAEAVPDLTADILRSLAPGVDRAARRTQELRFLVGLAGAMQLVLAVPVLVGAVGPAVHLGRDLGAFELALGAGLLLAGWQPRRAAGVLPIGVVVAVAATLGGIVDLVAGQASLVSELGHLAELVGVAALWALVRRLPDPPPTRPAIVTGTLRGA